MPQLFVLNVLDVMWSTGQNHVYASCCAWYTPAVACGSTCTTYQPSTGICYNQGKHCTATLAHSHKFLLPCALPCCWASYNQSRYILHRGGELQGGESHLQIRCWHSGARFLATAIQGLLHPDHEAWCT